MRLVRIESVQDGMELAHDIPAASLGSAPLLRRGVRLTAALAARLGPRGVRALWIEDDLAEGVVPLAPLSDAVRRSTEHAVVRCLNGARTSDGRLSADALSQLGSAALEVLHALEDCPVVRLRDPSGRMIEATIHIVDGVVEQPEGVGLYN